MELSGADTAGVRLAAPERPAVRRIFNTPTQSPNSLGYAKDKSRCSIFAFASPRQSGPRSARPGASLRPILTSARRAHQGRRQE